MSIYFTDTITRVSITTDIYGVQTQSESSPISCRIKNNNKLILDATGQEVLGELLIIHDKSYSFNFGDYIKIKTRWGKEFIQPDKLFLVKKVGERGGFSQKYGVLFL